MAVSPSKGFYGFCRFSSEVYFYLMKLGSHAMADLGARMVMDYLFPIILFYCFIVQNLDKMLLVCHP